jgi:hypothetical protein
MDIRRSGPIAFAVAAALLLSASPTALQRGPRPPAVLVVRDVTLIDGTGAAPKPHVTIVAQDGVIASIGSAADPLPAGATVVDGTGRVAAPGLFDAHVHVTGSTHAAAIEELGRALAGGVTSVWDMAGDARMAAELAREAAAGEIRSPSIYYVALMAGPAFFTDPRVLAASRGFEPGRAPWAQAITASTDVARAVASAKGSGASGIKLYAALDADLVQRATAEARQQGLSVVAHATVFTAKPSDLVAAGVTMLAHAAYLVWEGSPASSDFTKRASGDYAGVPADSQPSSACWHRCATAAWRSIPPCGSWASGSPTTPSTGCAHRGCTSSPNARTRWAWQSSPVPMDSPIARVMPCR